MSQFRSLAAALAVTFTVAAAAPVAAQSQQPEDRIAAKVNGEEIMLSDVMGMIQDLPPQYQQIPVSQLYPLLVRRAVNNKLMAAKAATTDIAENEELKAEVEQFRQNRILELYLIGQIEERITDEAMQARYKKYVAESEPDPSIHARHILLKTEEEAKAVITELKGGADFAELAKTKSTGPSGPRGGDLGFFKKGQMVPEFEQAAFLMAKGEFSATPVQTKFGWHVIMVEDRRDHPSFEEKADELRQELSGEVLTALVTDLRSGAEIEEFQIDGTPLPPLEAPAAQ